MKVLIREKISPHKFKTPEGYLICQDSILARTGKQTYRKNELFLDTDDDSEIEVDRPYDEVFSAETLASFENKPITIEHPDEDVTIDNYKDYAVGFVRDIRQGKTENGEDVIIGNLVITDKQAIEEIEAGQHTELSCGYDCDIVDEENPRQTKIRGNHVALCEQGRAGIAKIIDSVKDSDLYEGKQFKSKKGILFTITDIESGFSDVNGKPYVNVEYIVKFPNGKTFDEKNSVEVFFKNLKGDYDKEITDSVKDAPNKLTWDWWLNDHNKYDERISNILLSKVRLTAQDWEGINEYGGVSFENYKEEKGKEYNTDVHSSSFSTLQPIKYSVDVVWYRMGKDGNGIKQKQHVEFTENKEVYSYRGGYDSIKDESYPSRRGKKIHWDNRGLYGRILSDNDTLTNKTTIEETSTGKVYFISTRLMEKAIASGEAKIFDSIQDTLSPFDNGERYEVITHGRRKEYHEFTNDGEEAKREIQWNEGIYGMQELKDRKTGKVYRYANREIDKFNPNDSIGDSKLKDGIWCYPKTEEQVKKWNQIISRQWKKSEIDKLKNELYGVYGDDEFFDDLEDWADSDVGNDGTLQRVLKSWSPYLKKVMKVNDVPENLIRKIKDSNEKLYKVNGVFVSAIHPIDAVRKCRDAKNFYAKEVNGKGYVYKKDNDRIPIGVETSYEKAKRVAEMLNESYEADIKWHTMTPEEQAQWRKNFREKYKNISGHEIDRIGDAKVGSVKDIGTGRLVSIDNLPTEQKKQCYEWKDKLIKAIQKGYPKVKISIYDFYTFDKKDTTITLTLNLDNAPTDEEWIKHVQEAVEKNNASCFPHPPQPDWVRIYQVKKKVIKDSVHDGYYSDYDKKDKEFVKMALAEMRRYVRNWDYMSPQDKRNVGCTLGELKKRIAELEKVKDSINDYNPNNFAEIHAGDIYKLDYYQKIQGFILYYEIKEWDNVKHIGKIIEHWRYRDGTKETKTINVKNSDFDNYGIHLRNHINSHRAYKVSKVGDSIKVGDSETKQFQAYLRSISKLYHPNDMGIEKLTDYCKTAGIPCTIIKIKGWDQIGSTNEYVKKYLAEVELEGKIKHVLFEIYADMPEFKTKEINAYLTH